MSVHIKRRGISISLEEYLTTILKEGGNNNWIRFGNIAKSLGTTQASVTEAMQKLAKDGYIYYFPYKGVRLTNKGNELASSIVEKENEIKNLLIRIGVDEKESEDIACILEHKISDNAVKKLKEFVNKCVSDKNF
ncbi:Mn-dependent transcriptional regulator [Caldisphaera lagunensis DSM 15908]|uniref:Mn-dependent transcriptional regulator n=1 Tax=Caldisphaera lagunensis (strain DSM 15908 / JCM 11604 / ANMR 0165 / IC-154) TaxID=1056495 RepID=L0ABP5_CALLD|nr:metal-dependent transcriptional regulator [Caldisphaera lagunensis]AFZ70547.1 Mn-dependent transcriptional regulator [Caldisphaera lagunensis DSM 15908]